MFLYWLRIWHLGAKSMLLHPLRSALTVLGIFIGTASVIWLLAIGEGISRKAQEQITSLGANNIIVRSIRPPNEILSQQSGAVEYGITREDYLRLSSTIPSVEQVTPIRVLRRAFRRSGRTVEGRLVGCTPDYADVTLLKVDRGHFITDREVEDEINHCVLSAEVARTLFPFEDPIGRSVQVDADFYVVVGVMQPRMPTAGVGGSLAAEDFSSDVYIPLSTLWRRIGDTDVTIQPGSFQREIVQLNQVTLQVRDVDQVMLTSDVVRRTMEEYHKLNDFGITVPLELLEQARTTRLLFMLFMGLIAAISLAVGGIGIMNIMLATVTERTREIGVRRALGARRRDITRQFLAETVVLAVVGGMIGILGGFTCGPMLRWMWYGMEWLMPEAIARLPELVRSVEPVIVGWSVPMAFWISVSVGVLFGLYPAARAAQMDPIEALRHE